MDPNNDIVRKGKLLLSQWQQVANFCHNSLIYGLDTSNDMKGLRMRVLFSCLTVGKSQCCKRTALDNPPAMENLMISHNRFYT